MKALSLFSGIGGIDLACEWAGIKTVAFCEREPFCQKVLKKHWPDVPIFDDVKKLNKQMLIDAEVIGDGRTIDIISAGYPCQPFSHAGKRKGTEDDRHLWPEVARILQEVRPRWFLGENVAGHVTLGLDDVLSDLESLGYTAQAFVIPAAAVGAPHRRDRVFILGHTECSGCSGQPRRRSGKELTDGYCELEEGALANSCGSGCEECDSAGQSNGSGYDSGRIDSRGATGPTQSGLGGVLDGISKIMDRIGGTGMDRDSVILGALEEGAIEVDFDSGKIYSRRIRGREGELVELKGAICNGYIVHRIYYKGVKKQVRAHRVVWMAAHGRIPEGYVIDHINRDKKDNSLSNLRLVDAKGNAENRRSYENEGNPTAKLSMDDVLIIRELYAQGHASIREIAEEFGVGKSQIHNIVTGKNWSWPAALGQPKYDWEPPRVATGVKNRVARLKALGNAVVPQQIYPILYGIKLIHEMEVG